ncbi:MAG: pyridoxamine 5'-phosphate oxidase family protein [Spirochaetia bacterium]|nr:pyridoxamine 5'-phosphate oxidase family protein [Spirochaetia bacterium]
MAQQFEKINQSHKEFIEKQKIFFTATAGTDGRINLSPKGLDSFRVINETTIIWLNLTGSGNETMGHIQENNRMTIMFCSFDEKPLILRLYGKAKIHFAGSENFNKFSAEFADLPGKRQIYEMKVEMVQTSCGWAVPHYNFVKERQTLNEWSGKKDPSEIKEYWEERNNTSIDGKNIEMPIL